MSTHKSLLSLSLYFLFLTAFSYIFTLAALREYVSAVGRRPPAAGRAGEPSGLETAQPLARVTAMVDPSEASFVL